jgi:hypothetical protein
MTTTKKETTQLYEHKRLDNGPWTTVATKDIRKGSRILCDIGLICLKSGLSYDDKSKRYLEGKIARLPEKQKQVFYDLPKLRPFDCDPIYARYLAYATVIRHSPKYSGIFPALSKVAHSCRPNCVSAVLPCNVDPRKDWILALHAVRDIQEGEELTRFWLRGNNCQVFRKLDHLALVGYRCKCAACQLTGGEMKKSDYRRSQMGAFYNIISASHESAEDFYTKPDTIKGLFHQLFEVKQTLRLEGIVDHSMWLIYGLACTAAFRFGVKRPFPWLFGHQVLEMDRHFLGADNQIHQHEPLTQFWHENLGPEVQGEALTALLKLHKADMANNERQLWFWLLCVPEVNDRARYNDFESKEFFPDFDDLPFAVNSLEPSEKCVDEDATAEMRLGSFRQWHNDEDNSPKKAWCLIAEVFCRGDGESGIWILKDWAGGKFPFDTSTGSFPQDDDDRPKIEDSFALWFAARTELPDGRIGLKATAARWKTQVSRGYGRDGRCDADIAVQVIPRYNLDQIYRFNKVAMMFGRHAENGFYCANCEEITQWRDLDYRLDPLTQLFWFCSRVSE